ncbi:MAG: multidrug effflux MFS transporter [Pseudomonadota bacterium]
MALGSADPPARAARSPAPLWLLILISTVAPTAMNMYVPALAGMQADLTTSVGAMQLTLSVFLAFLAIGAVISGPISDIFGRRPIFIAGFTLYLAATVLCALAPNVETLIAGRLLQAIGGCVSLSLTRAIIRDLHGAENSAAMIGAVTMGMAVAPLLTPLLGGLIYEAAGWRMIFVTMAILGAAALALVIVRFDETHPGELQPGIGARFRAEVIDLLSLRDFWAFAGTLGLLCMAFFSILAAGAFVAVDVYNLGAAQYGLYFVMIVAGYVFGNFIVARYGPRIGIVPMIKIGNVICLCGVSLSIILTSVVGWAHPLALFGPMLIVGVGNGFALPNLIAACVSLRPHLAGTASGLAGMFQFGSGALTGVVAGWIIDTGWQQGTVWPLLGLLTFGIVACLALSLTLHGENLR